MLHFHRITFIHYLRQFCFCSGGENKYLSAVSNESKAKNVERHEKPTKPTTLPGGRSLFDDVIQIITKYLKMLCHEDIDILGRFKYLF